MLNKLFTWRLLSYIPTLVYPSDPNLLKLNKIKLTKHPRRDLHGKVSSYLPFCSSGQI